MKKLLATLLASTMALSAIAGLTACGGDDANKIVVWAPEAAIKCYEKLADEWKAANEQYKDYTVEFSVHAEGETETDLSINPAAGADIFFFESGQIQTMEKKMYLQTLPEEYTQKIKARDSQTSYASILDDAGNAFAFPCTSDNGYFMYYDKTYWTDPSDLESLDKMIAKVKADGKKIGFDYANGYYEVTWFMGLGCKMDWTDKAQTKYFTDVQGEKGLKAGQASIYYLGGDNANIWVKGDVTGTIGAGFEDKSMVAGIGGTWVAAGDVLKTHVEAGGRNYDEVVGATKLPKFTLNGTGTEYQMGSFMGGKYCGINQYKEDPNKILAAISLADYLCDEAGQAARFEATNAGPSNVKVAATEAVRNNTLINALNLQNAAGGYAQLSQNGLWDAMNEFGDKCQSGDITGSNLQDSLNTLAKAMAKGGTLVDANGNAVNL